MRPRFFAPDISADARVVALPPDEAHHLTQVLRLRVGDELAVFDGRGHEWHARVAAASKRRVEVELLGAASPVPEPRVPVTLAVALLKGDQMDVVVRDATMLGVTAIVPMVSTHVVVGRAGRSGSSARRWQRIAVASAKQCGRAVVPAIADVRTFDDLLGGGDNLRVMCVEPAVAANATSQPTATPRAAAIVLIGPEGGWSTTEIDHARAAGVRFLSLGPRTLRAETAPTVALAALWTMWGWE